MKKFRLIKSVSDNNIYQLYVKKWGFFSIWGHIDTFAASNDQIAINKAKEKALSYTIPVAEFEI